MKKGFAISSMLYAMLVLFLIILFGVLYIIGNQTLILNRSKKNIFDALNGSNKVEVYKDKSGASYPNLAGDLVPVYYDSATSTWNKANVYEEWYDYDKKNWANAVILDDDIIPDISGNKNHGYLQGATRNDSSVTTDGVDDYVYAGLAGHEFKNEFSIVVRTKIFNYNDLPFLENAEGAGISLYTSDSRIRFHIYSNTKNGYVGISSTETYNINKFYTIVGVFKDNKLHLYINGKEAAEPVEFTGITDIKISTAPFTIGANPPGISKCNQNQHTCTQMSGNNNIEFTDALIFDRALSENEIKYDYAGKITNLSNTSKMILRYDLDDEIKPDTPLPEEIIESHFVWIPKYRYKLWEVGTASSNPHEIQVEFTTEDTTDTTTSCKAPMLSGETGNCAKDKWMTHPAFINFDVDGIWAGKFETTGDTNKVTIKPNATPLTNLQLNAIFNAAYTYERNILDSHMMKNTEWGAVAYLAHSKYGINGEINFNNYYNTDKYLTGCGSTPKSEASNSCNSYTTDLGIKASTTGNIYGIYDTNGGTYEAMASYLKTGVGTSKDVSGLTVDNYNAKYFDAYQSTSTSDFTGRILGDATTETRAWYGAAANFIGPEVGLWFGRGGYSKNKNSAGQFNFVGDSEWTGKPLINVSFRIVLTPQ